ncbi:hypothetical protein BS78_09G107100 [Paspalum vaginatum]|nr:hypothetical protein BS78_09G107100 [Paspalum vaginatum]
MVVPSGAGGAEGGDGGSAAPGLLAPPSSGGPRVKGSWTPEEDELLRRSVARHGARNWSVISGEVPGRSGKSCRLRWCNQLSPGVERRAFTPEEDALIVAAHAQFGNKWATIARLLHGRTDNSVKNHWNSTLRRQRRAAAAGIGAGVGEREEEDEDMLDDDEEEDEDDEDGSSGDSVLVPPPKKRPCLIAAQHPNCHLAVKPPELAKPPAPEPLTSLTLSLPGGGVPETPPAPQSAAPSVTEGAAKMEMKAKLEQDPWFMPVMRRMICEEVQRQMQGRIAAPAACRRGADDDGRAAANGQD